MILVKRQAPEAEPARTEAEMDAELDAVLRAWGRLSTTDRLAVLRAALLSDAQGVARRRPCRAARLVSARPAAARRCAGPG